MDDATTTTAALPAEFSIVAPALNEIQQAAPTVRTIRTALDYARVGELLKVAKGALRQVEEQRTKVSKPLNEALRALNAQAKTAAAPFESFERQAKAALVAYADEQERLRRAEQARLDALARKEAEKLAAQAAKAEAAGREERAAMLAERAASVVAPIAAQAAPKVAGQSFREVWHFEVVDAAKLPREYLVEDEQKIRKVVGALKGDANIPGVRVWSTRELASRAS